MSAAEKAEATLLVIKRLLKWAAFAFLAFVLVVAGVLGWEQFQEVQRTRPKLLTSYMDVTLGDSLEQVQYARGLPDYFAYKQPADAANPFSEFPMLIQPSDEKNGHLIKQSLEWQWFDGKGQMVVAGLNKPGGIVEYVSCHATQYFSCSSVFGISNGSTEDEVLDKLGKPDNELLERGMKVLRYSSYNLTLYLERKKVTRVEIAAGENPRAKN